MQRFLSFWIDILFLTLLLGIFLSIFLGSRPLFVPDEGRYAEIAREMVSSGNFITPYLNEIKYFEKPVLFYWLLAIAMKIAGSSLWSLRSINILLALFTALLTYVTGSKLFNRETGLLAAFILSTSTLYFVMAHMISLDLAVTAFISASLYAFLLGCQNEKNARKNRYYFWFAASMAGFAVLTKGLIGIVFPMLIIISWIVLLGNYRIIKFIYLPSSLFIFLLITVPWHVLVGWQNPEFFYFYFIEQHFLRYTTLEIGHYQPVWFFIPCLLLGFFPWIVFLPQTIYQNLQLLYQNHKQYQTQLFLFIWAVFIFSFFSFSKSKLIPYILPVIPPLAILTADYLVRGFTRKNIIDLKIGFFCLVLFSIAITTAMHLFIGNTQLPNIRMTKILLYSAGTLLILGTTGAYLFALRNIYKATICTIITVILFLPLTLASMPYLDTRSIQSLAFLIKPLLSQQDEVITFNQYYQDLPFYLERRVSILNWRNELSFGILHQNSHDWMINDNTFWELWHSNKRVFVMLGLEEYEHLKSNYPQEKFYVWGKTINNVLMSNKRRKEI